MLASSQIYILPGIMYDHDLEDDLDCLRGSKKSWKLSTSCEEVGVAFFIGARRGEGSTSLNVMTLLSGLMTDGRGT